MDLLVFIAIIGFLMAMLVPAVQKVRQAANRVQCQNNLRQIAIATHDINDARGGLPPIAGPFRPKDPSDGSLFFHLLPYLEQDPLYKSSRKDGRYCVWHNQVYSRSLPLFLCPDDPSAPPDKLYKNWLATGNYAGNWLVFGTGGAAIPRTFQDGTSLTIMYTERYQMCHGTPCAWGYPGIYYWSPMFARYSQAPFQVQPAAPACDPALAQSTHPGGLNVCMGDASVRFVSANVSPATWWAACTPAADDVLGKDW
jgi:hypothetical protein